MSRRALAGVLVLVAAATCGVIALADGSSGGLVEEVTLQGLRTPTDVAALEGGWVVADAAAGEVVRFGADGTETWRVPGMGHPSGIAVSGDQVLVAEQGAHRVAVLDVRGAVQRRIDLGDLAPTDVAAGADLDLWVSSAPASRLVRIGPDGSIEVEVQHEMRAPRALVSDGQGGVWAADALDGNIVHVGRSGAVEAVIAGWGASEGRFLKPKGLARGGGGGLVVSDSHQGVIQEIAADGQFKQLVVSADAPWIFTHPMGVATDGERIAVADAAEGRVVVLRPGGAAFLGGRLPAAGWLVRSSPVHDPDPSVTCRQCHDGTRSPDLSVWDPAALPHPVGEGDLQCTSCHRLHDLAPASDPEVIRGVDPQVVSTGPVTVSCINCHAEALGSGVGESDVGHPIGRSAPAGSDVAGLLAAGARFGDDPAEAIGCRTCHRPHGGQLPDLLVRSAADGSLCLSCHAAQHPGRSAHPVLIQATPEARASVDQLGGALGPNGELVCVSCHDPHGARARHLLRASGTRSACRGCHHEEAQPMAAGPHTAVGCAQCHAMHRGETIAARGDQTCATCHAAEVTGPGHPHTGDAATCTGCHDPHGDQPGLVSGGCSSCHEQIAVAVEGGPHDAGAHPVRGSQEICTSCHDPHGRADPFQMTAVAGVNPATGRCLTCHDGSTGATPIERWTHPTDVLLVATQLGPTERGPYATPTGEPAAAGRLGEITCRTCHQPHSPGPPEDVTRWCASCHGGDAAKRVSDYHALAGTGP